MPQPPGITPDGHKLRQIRIGRGITVTNLAKLIGRPRQSIWNIEGTSRPISPVFASQLANALGVRVEDFTKTDGDDQEPAALAS